MQQNPSHLTLTLLVLLGCAAEEPSPHTHASSAASDTLEMDVYFASRGLKLPQLEVLMAYVQVDPDSGDIYITGATLHVRSGSGVDPVGLGVPLSGRGNLVLGYNVPDDGDFEHRSGEHCRIIGDGHRWTVGGPRSRVEGRLNLPPAPARESRA